MNVVIPATRSPRAIASVATGLLAVVVLLVATAPTGQGGTTPIRIGAVFPLGGATAPLAAEQLAGLDTAAAMANEDGGVGGRPLELDVRDVTRPDEVEATVEDLADGGANIVVGAYASELSIAVSRAAARRGLVYWEAGAVADRITGRGLPGVFRVGATGRNLGANSVRFAATELVPRLGTQLSQVRVAIVSANDDYARSVADAAMEEADRLGFPDVDRRPYGLLRPDFERLVADLREDPPDILILASHVADGVAFRRTMLEGGLRVGAFIGSTMAQCGPAWGSLLGEDAIGTFASDRPTGGFDPDALGPQAHAVYDRFASWWEDRLGVDSPSDEGLAGFSAGWALFDVVLPAAVAAGSADPAAVIAAAQAVDLPAGSLPDGAGLRFSAAPGSLGQNERAAAVIWQWQAVEHSVTVWPEAYATGPIGFVPLPR
jgi:branched-chain amino acid transport system substrate-binding protein